MEEKIASPKKYIPVVYPGQKKGDKKITYSIEKNNHFVIHDRRLSGQQEFFENATIGYFVFDANECVIWINQYLLDFLGYPPFEFIGKPAKDFFLEKTKFATLVKRLKKQQILNNFEITMTCKNGTQKHVFMNSYARFENDTFKYARNYIQDITEKQQKVTELSNTNTRITRILESISDGFMSLNTDRRYVYVNSKAEKLLKIKRSKLVGKQVEEIFPGLSQSPKYKKYLEQIKNKKSITFEEYFAGLGTWFSISIYPSDDGLTIYFQDVSERQKAIEVLVESERQFRQLTETIPQIVWTSNTKGELVYCNSRWYEYTGYGVDKPVSDKVWNSFIHPDDLEHSTVKWVDSFKSGKAYQIEYRLKRLDGVYHWFLERAIPITNHKGKIIKWFGTCTDIDDQKQMEKRKEEFMGIASHELKTPITTIKAFTQILERHLEQTHDSRALGYLSKMHNQLNKLTKLVYDLLDISKISTGKLQLNTEAFSIDDLITETQEAMQQISNHHTIVKEGVAKCIIFADKYRIEQVLENLITNAIKYSPKSDKIILKVDADTDEVIISVTDFGIGIAQEKQKKIFEQFYRVEDSEKAGFPGLGLGLYISQEIVKRHHGKMWLESSKGKGSTFYFSLPTHSSL
ncbi:PAS domain S-box protein [Candidatus Roizmanbacteria bacterium]|nr:PAS domain S-box protein [Candidatus Roizmanbacteria bacterium]